MDKGRRGFTGNGCQVVTPLTTGDTAATKYRLSESDMDGFCVTKPVRGDLTLSF